MSRITRARIEAGDSLTSTDLNNRYSDYTQTDLDENNVVDGAIDAAQMPSNAIILATQQASIGTSDLQHTSFGTVTRTVGSGPATPTVVNPTTIATSPSSGWALSQGTTLRVYVTLAVRGQIGLTTDPHLSTVMGSVEVDKRTTGGTTHINIGAHAWLLQLQWDKTSSSLGAFENVPNQNNMQSVWTGGKYGAAVTALDGTALIPAMWAGGVYWDDGKHNASVTVGPATLERRERRATGWRSVTLSWVYRGTAPVTTVYGWRLVAHGLYHPYNNGSDNGIVLDTQAFTGTAPTLNYGIGNLLAIHMRSE